MNQIIAVIPSESLEVVRSALIALNIGGMTISENLQHARALDLNESSWMIDSFGMTRIEIVSIPEDVNEILRAIIAWVRETSSRPRGIVYVSELEEVIRIRTQEKDCGAIQ